MKADLNFVVDRMGKVINTCTNTAQVQTGYKYCALLIDKCSPRDLDERHPVVLSKTLWRLYETKVAELLGREAL